MFWEIGDRRNGGTALGAVSATPVQPAEIPRADIEFPELSGSRSWGMATSAAEANAPNNLAAG
jgi:hypothetical protein